MATVTGLTAARMLEIEAATVVGGAIDGSGHMVLTKHDGSTVDMGSIPATFPVSSDTVKGIVELATSAETIAGTDGTLAVTPNGLASLTSDDTRKGIVELATSAETITGTDDTRAVTPSALATLTSSDTRKGLVELATNAETITGTDAVRAVTPASLAALTADDTRKGLVELATSAETTTGTDAVRAVTPAGVKPTVDALKARLTSLEAVQVNFIVTPLAESALASAYPFGFSIMDVSGWSLPGGFGNVHTVYLSDYRTQQTFYLPSGGSNPPRAWIRHYNTFETGWSVWREYMTILPSLTVVNDDILQRKSGAWTNRTMAQLATDLSAAGEFAEVRLHNGTAYVDTDGAHIYAGTVDPGSVPNGSVWFDTTP